MADDLAAFTKAFEKIRKASEAANEEVDRSAKLIAQTAGIIQEGVKEIGLRVGELKEGGATGTDIKDFLGDKDVKSFHDSCLAHLESIDDDLKHMADVKKDIKSTVADYAGLKKDLAAEIAKRRKAVSTKVGTGNKSLPDMEKLLDAVEKYETARNDFTVTMFYEPEKFSDHQKDFENGLARQIAAAKDVKLDSFQKMMQEQALNVRVLTGRVNKANALLGTVLEECDKAAKAIESRDNTALMTAKANIMAPIKELAGMADTYKKALADQWISSGIAKSKDKDKITKGVNGVIAMYAKASAELKKVANARLS